MILDFQYRQLAVIIIASFGIIFFSSCENDISKVNLITQKENLPNEKANNVEILYSEEAKIEARLISPQLERFASDSPYVVMPNGVHVQFFDDTAKVESELFANYGIYYEIESKMEANNDVVVINSKGEKLNTEHLIWEENKKKIHSNAFVKITTAEEIIYGDGFEANQNFTQYKIFKIKGTINIEKNDTLKNN